MTALSTKLCAALGAAHHYVSRSKHTWTDAHGTRAFAPFIRIEILQEPGQDACYLYRFSTDDMIADTWHATVDEALHQAEWEFGIRRNDWQVICTDGLGTKAR